MSGREKMQMAELLAEAHKEIAKLSNQLKKSKRKLKRKDEKLAASEADNERLTDKIHENELEFEEKFAVERLAHQTVNDSHSNECNSLRRQLRSCQSEITRLAAREKYLEEKAKEYPGHILTMANEVKKIVETKDAEISTLKAKVADQEELIRLHSANASYHEKGCESLRAEIDNQFGDREAAYKAQIEELQNDLKFVSDAGLEEIASLEKYIFELGKEIQTWKDTVFRLSTSQTDHSNLESENERLSKQLADAGVRAEQSRHERNNIVSTNQKLLKDNNILTTTVKVLKESKDAMSAEHDKIIEQLKVKINDLERVRIPNLENQVKMYAQEIGEMNIAKIEVNGILQKLANEKERYEKQLTEANARVEAYEVSRLEIKVLKRHIDDLQKQRDILTKNITNLGEAYSRVDQQKREQDDLIKTLQASQRK